MKKTILIFCFVLFIFTGCTDKNNDELNTEKASNSGTESNSDKILIGFVTKTIKNPYFEKMEFGIKNAARNLDIRLISKSTTSEVSTQHQYRIVEEMIEKGVQAIIIAAVSDINILPALKKAEDKGIKIILVDEKFSKADLKLFGLSEMPFIAVDNEQGAYLAGKYLAQTFSKPTKVAIIEGLMHTTNAQLRKKGAMRAFNENKLVTVVASESGEWEMEQAKLVTREILKKYNDLGAIFCANDFMAFGVLLVLKELGRNDIKVSGYDNVFEAKELILNGDLLLTIDQHPEIQGELALQYAIDLIQGKHVKQNTFVDVSVVTYESFKK